MPTQAGETGTPPIRERPAANDETSSPAGKRSLQLAKAPPQLPTTSSVVAATAASREAENRHDRPPDASVSGESKSARRPQQQQVQADRDAIGLPLQHLGTVVDDVASHQREATRPDRGRERPPDTSRQPLRASAHHTCLASPSRRDSNSCVHRHLPSCPRERSRRCSRVQSPRLQPRVRALDDPDVCPTPE